MVGWNNSSAIYIATSESCEPKRFVRCWNRVEKQHIQEQQSVPLLQPECGFWQQNHRTWLSIGTRMKKSWWFSFIWMLDIVAQGTWVLYRINKDKGDDCLPLLAFRRHVVNITFLKYWKEDRFSSSHLGIRNIPSDICYDDKTLPGAIWTQAYSEPLQTSKSGCFGVNS